MPQAIHTVDTCVLVQVKDFFFKIHVQKIPLDLDFIWTYHKLFYPSKNRLRIHAEKWVKINGSMHIWTLQVSSFKTNTHNPIKVYIFLKLCSFTNELT